MGVHEQDIRNAARKKWDNARRAAFWVSVNAALQNKHTTLLDLNQVARRLRLRNTAYRGVCTIPLDMIVGSMGRYNDFSNEFLPMRRNAASRWQGVAALALDPRKPGFPPIEAFKVGKWYFVKDGNHRCSVARELGMKTIEAIVWEYTDELPPHTPADGIQTLLLTAESEDFARETRLDVIRPGHDVRFSQPGGYTDVLRQIMHYQDVLSKIDETEVSHEYAVLTWYDMFFTSTVQLINESGVLMLFPERTAADLFVWIMNNRDELASRYGGRFGIREAVREFRWTHPRTLLAQLRYLVARWLQKVLGCERE